MPEDRFLVTPPVLDIQERDGLTIVKNVVLGTSLRCDSRSREVLEFFRSPRKLSDCLAAGYLPREIDSVVDAAVVMDVEQLLRTPVTNSIGKVLSFEEFLADPAAVEFAVLGVPTDAGTSGEPGARNGPALIRSEFCCFPLPLHAAAVADRAAGAAALVDLEFRRSYAGALPVVADLGNVVTLAGEGIATIGARLEMFVSLVHRHGVRLALLGGDHSITHWILRAMLQQHSALGVLHFDAHHDLVPPLHPGANYVSHFNPFRAALRSPALKRLHQIGLRTVEMVWSPSVPVDERLSYVSAREVQAMTPEEVFAGIPRDLPYYLSFDIDCVSPDVAPETGTPVPGGLGYYQALELIDFAARNFDLVGFDLVEVAGNAHDSNRAGRIAARLVLQTILGRAAFEPLTSYHSQ